jgi:putative peptide zinc metalloprotease protein
MRSAYSPVSAPGETAWFVGYGLLSTLYRFAVLWFVISIVTEKFFALGVLLAIWLISQQILLPLFKSAIFIVNSPSLEKNRARAIVSCLCGVLLFVSITVFIPMPSYTLAEGVAWQPEEALIKAEHDGFAGNLLVHNNQDIIAGTTVLQLSDPILETQLKIAQARVRELQSKYRANQLSNFVEAGKIKDAASAAKSELDFVLKKMESMSIKSLKSGKVLLPEADDIPGRFIQQGELLGYILSDEPSTIRLAVSQDNIGQVRNSVIDINVRLANDLSKNYKASIIRQAPEASNHLPSAALTTKGGGKFIAAPNQKNDRITMNKVFLIDLGFDTLPTNLPLGTRVYVRFSHESEPLAVQWYRRIRQAFLRQFNA